MASEEAPKENADDTEEQNVEIQKIDSEEELPPAPEREKWASKISYYLTLVGYAVGFGNVWRFPYQLRDNGGLVFFIPYLIMLAVIGTPIFFLELAVGQRRKKGVVYAWAEMSPSLGGIGIACGWLCFMVGLYYNTLIAYCFSYFVDSFRSPLPWTNCVTAGGGNKNFSDECRDKLNGRATKYYWFRRTLDMSASYEMPGNYSLYLFGYHVIVWSVIFLILFKGTKCVGSVVYFTAVFPFVVLIAFFIGNLAIEPEKRWLGAYRLLRPNWGKLVQPVTWLKAGSQIFFSLGLAEGVLVVFASYSPTRNNCLRDAVSISIINCCTSSFAALVVFPMIGALGHQKYDECFNDMKSLFPTMKAKYEDKHDIYFLTTASNWTEISDDKPIMVRYGIGEIAAADKEAYFKDAKDANEFQRINDATSINTTWTTHGLHDVLRDCSIGFEATASGGGTGFVFMAFTESVKDMPGANFWSLLFFFMLMMLGIDSGFACVEGVISVLVDLTHMKRFNATALSCGVTFLLAIVIFPFGWGTYILDLLDQWTANWTLLIIALLECISVAWIYGLAKISYDIRLMTGSKPNVYILLCWKYLSPIVIVLLLIGSVIQFILSSVNSQGIKYTAFNPSHKDQADGDVILDMPPYVLTVGFFLMIFCIIWIPIHYFLRKTRWNMLKDQAPADFPEEELRQERDINVEKEEDQFSRTEKALMGKQSLLNLQEQRNRTKSKTSLHSRGSRNSTASKGSKL